MFNGDSIKMQLWYNEVLIINKPGNDNQYYVFSIGVTGTSGDYGLYYSIVDMSLDSGNGAVVQKNIQLLNFKCTDGLIAVKHGNGRDWWIFAKRWDFVNNTFYRFLITPFGISNSFQQNIGNSTDNGFTRMQFSHRGDKLLVYTYTGLMELCDFDRCTGLISNPQIVYTESIPPPWRGFWTSAFSPNDSILYMCSILLQPGDSSRLYQFDLTSADISNSVDTLWETSDDIQMGQMKVAPDNKIYLSSNFYGGYPYGDTAYYTTNMNLSVINDPNVLGGGCNLQPFSFYLGGKRCYFGLPNNPYYELGPDSGSICDTLNVGIENQTISQSVLHIFYHSGWKTAFINAEGLSTGKYALALFDISGKQIFLEEGNNHRSYFTKNMDCAKMANGLYIVSIITGSQNLTGRLLVY
jgi:hypothetical protein